MDTAIIDRFKAIVGEQYVISGKAEMAPYGIDRTTVWQPNPSLVVRPNSVEQVQKIVLLANELNLPLVPSGGRTGYSGGAVAKDGEVVVTMERMNRILHFSEDDQDVTVEAGVITQHLQHFAEQHGLFYPVSLASQGSCHIGGNVATNAGGIHVIRYGGTREQVTGLKVVTGNGDVLELNRGLVKNNCGPDLRHLYIGSEGILGFICEVTVKLQPPPPPQTVMVVSAAEIPKLLKVFQLARKTFTLSAFEFFSQQAMDAVTAHTGQHSPFSNPSPVYGLLEFDTPHNQNNITGFFEHCQHNGWADDAVIAQSDKQAKALWQLRENISESLAPHKPLKHDVAVRLEKMAEFIERLEESLNNEYPEIKSIWFGHLGDGNIHVNVLPPSGWSEIEFAEQAPRISEVIYGLVGEFGGSVSAEHGIGLLKRDLSNKSQKDLVKLYQEKFRLILDTNKIINLGKVIKR